MPFGRSGRSFFFLISTFSRPFLLYDLTISGSYAPDFWIAGLFGPAFWQAASLAGVQRTPLCTQNSPFRHVLAYTNKLLRHIFHEDRISSSYFLAILWTSLGNIPTTITRRNITLSLLDRVRHNMIILQSQFGADHKTQPALHCNAERHTPSSKKLKTIDHVDHSCSPLPFEQQLPDQNQSTSTFPRPFAVKGPLTLSISKERPFRLQHYSWNDGNALYCGMLTGGKIKTCKEKKPERGDL